MRFFPSLCRRLFLFLIDALLTLAFGPLATGTRCLIHLFEQVSGAFDETALFAFCRCLIPKRRMVAPHGDGQGADIRLARSHAK